MPPDIVAGVESERRLAGRAAEIAQRTGHGETYPNTSSKAEATGYEGISEEASELMRPPWPNAKVERRAAAILRAVYSRRVRSNAC